MKISLIFLFSNHCTKKWKWMQCEVCTQFMQFKSWYHKSCIWKMKKKQNKKEVWKLFFLGTKKKTSKMCKHIYKHTNITNKQATNKMCTLKNKKKLKEKKQRTYKWNNETKCTYLQNDILKLNIYGPNS